MPESPDPLHAAIKRAVPALLPGRPAVVRILPVSRSGGLHPDVWDVTARDGTRLVAKHQAFAPLTRGQPHDLLDVEQTVCGLLRDAGCPVPRVYGVDPDVSLIFFGWCGDRTLDDCVQDTHPAPRSRLAERVLRGFADIRLVLQANAPNLAPRAFPGCDPDGLLEAWRSATGGLPENLPVLVERLTGSPPPHPARARRLLAELLHRLGRVPPELGPTDYNARNIVLDAPPETPRFIEFAKLGWDWPERRLVQYTTSLGAGRTDGGFYSLLSPRTRVVGTQASVACWGVEAGADVRLDGHHFVFHLLAARMLLAARESSPEGRRLRDAWRNPESRLRQLRALLALPLSADPRLAELRALFS